MISNGLKMEQHMSSPLEEEDFGEDTLIITMDEEQKQKVLMGYTKALNVYTLKSLVGEEGEIPDPYGGPLTDCLLYTSDVYKRQVVKSPRSHAYKPLFRIKYTLRIFTEVL